MAMWLGLTAKGDKVLSTDAVNSIVSATALSGPAVAQHARTSAKVLVPVVRQMLTRVGARDLAKQKPDGRLMMGDYNALADINSFIAVHIDAEQGLIAEFSGKEALARRDRSTLYVSDGPALDRLFSALTNSAPPSDLVARFESPPTNHEQASDTQLMALATPVQIFASFPRVYPRRMGEEPRMVRVVLGCLPDMVLSVADNKVFGTDGQQADAALWRMAAIWYTTLRAMQLERTEAAILAYTPSQAPQHSAADGHATIAAKALAFVLRTHFANAFRLVLLCCPASEYQAICDALVNDDSRGQILVRLGVAKEVDPLGLAAELAAVRLETGSLLRVALFVPTNWRSLRLGTIGMNWNNPATEDMSLCEFVALGTTLLLAHRDLGPRWWSSAPQRIKNPFSTIDMRRPLPFHEPGTTGRPVPTENVDPSSSGITPGTAGPVTRGAAKPKPSKQPRARAEGNGEPVTVPVAAAAFTARGKNGSRSTRKGEGSGGGDAQTTTNNSSAESHGKRKAETERRPAAAEKRKRREQGPAPR